LGWILERKCRAPLKNNKGKILDEFLFGNDTDGILVLINRIYDHGTKKM
jgi:hypothetical protein